MPVVDGAVTEAIVEAVEWVTPSVPLHMVFWISAVSIPRNEAAL